MQRYLHLMAVIGISLLLTACSAAAKPAATPGAAPTAADTTVTAEARLEPVRYVEIAFNAGGVVSEVLVQEGQAVKKGDPLIRLGDESDTNYAAAQLELVSAKQALNDLQAKAGTDLAQAVIDLKEAREEYDQAVDYLDYLQNTPEVTQREIKQNLVQTPRGWRFFTKPRVFTGPVPPDWIVDAENDLALKKARLDEAQRNYDRLKGGIDADELAVLEARLEAAETGLAAFTVTAPFDGVVAKLPTKIGNSIEAGEPAVTIADFSHWIVKTTDLTELDVVKIKEGDPVTVSLEAIPGAELKGTIDSIGHTYSENQGDVVYEVTILLNDTDPAMRWGMTAKVKFVNQD